MGIVSVDFGSSAPRKDSQTHSHRRDAFKVFGEELLRIRIHRLENLDRSDDVKAVASLLDSVYVVGASPKTSRHFVLAQSARDAFTLQQLEQQVVFTRPKELGQSRNVETLTTTCWVVLYRRAMNNSVELRGRGWKVKTRIGWLTIQRTALSNLFKGSHIGERHYPLRNLRTIFAPTPTKLILEFCEASSTAPYATEKLTGSAEQIAGAKVILERWSSEAAENMNPAIALTAQTTFAQNVFKAVGQNSKGIRPSLIGALGFVSLIGLTCFTVSSYESRRSAIDVATQITATSMPVSLPKAAPRKPDEIAKELRHLRRIDPETALSDAEELIAKWKGTPEAKEAARLLPGLRADSERYAKERAESEWLATHVAARSLVSAYDANAVSADKMYKGRVLKIVGTIGKIGKDITGEPYVTLDESQDHLLQYVQVFFAESQVDKLASLSKGQPLTVEGTIEGSMAGAAVRVNDARIVPDDAEPMPATLGDD